MNAQVHGRLDDYELLRELSDGTGSEAVYEAVHVLLPRRVILRVLRPEMAGISAVAMRLVRQAYILEALRSSAAPRMYECGRIGDRPWIAIELVAGERLPRKLNAHGVCTTVRELASVLAHAHARGIVHGDVRREHVVRTAPDRGTPLCLVDWTSARLDQDGSGDVYALGALARELLGEVAPPRLAALLGQMQAPRPAARPTAAEVHHAAARLCGELLEEADSVMVEEIVLPPPGPARVTVAGIAR